MQVNSTSNDYYQGNQQTQKPTQELDKNAFMQILVNQLKYQNPMEPQDSETFINQMVQLSTMEQMSNLTANMERMLQSNEFNRAVSLIGHQVTALNTNGEVVEGTIEKVSMAAGEPRLVVNNSEYSMGQIVYISEPPVEEPEPETETGEENITESDNDTEEDTTADVEE
ncbi:MAG: hypothetical protein FH756_19430 [Firmicutes bacterium]|nr:hypothetical protein [Bacillota bacterium]